MEDIRAFVAVKIDEKSKDSLSKIIDALSSSGTDVRWVHPENLHITLKFIGNISESELATISKALETAANFKAFKLLIKGVDAIPNLQYPRIVFASLKGETEILNRLASQIESALIPLGVDKEERGFLPHLTLGRVKSFHSKTALMNSMRKYHSTEIGTVLVDRFHLMKSELLPGKPIYSDISEIYLNRGEGK